MLRCSLRTSKVGLAELHSMTEQEYPPGTRAPASGTYEQRNVLGTSTGVRVTVARGEIFAAAPRGFTWMKLELPAGQALD